jgi:hypothetical protein
MGSVVNALAAVADMPVATTISGRTTERLENTGRRLKAMRMTETASRSRRAREGVEARTGGRAEAKVVADRGACGCNAFLFFKGRQVAVDRPAVAWRMNAGCWRWPEGSHILL